MDLTADRRLEAASRVIWQESIMNDGIQFFVFLALGLMVTSAWWLRQIALALREIRDTLAKR